MRRLCMILGGVAIAITAVLAEPTVSRVTREESGYTNWPLIELTPRDLSASQGDLFLQGTELNAFAGGYVYDPASGLRRDDVMVRLQPPSSATLTTRLCTFRVSDDAPIGTGLVVRLIAGDGRPEIAIPGFTIGVTAPSDNNTAEATAAAVAAAAAAQTAAAEAAALLAMPIILSITDTQNMPLQQAKVTPRVKPRVELLLTGTNLSGLTSGYVYDVMTGQPRGDVNLTLGPTQGTSRLCSFEATDDAASGSFMVRFIAGNCGVCGAQINVMPPAFNFQVLPMPLQPFHVTLPRINATGTRGE